MRSDVDAIKDRLGIAEIVSSYTKLEKAGQSYKGRCPFHSEKTPSFFVSPLRQSYYCFGCGEKGDIFTFVERMEGLEFREALKLLADKAGIELKETTPRDKEEKEKLFEVVERAALFFEKELNGNALAKNYLLGRGLTPETIKHWRIGYAPSESKSDWRALYHHLLAQGYDQSLLFQAGLVKVKEGKEPYDVFRDRLIFPLANANGRTIAFSGRALSKETEPKYLNSPDTTLFNKSETLYGLDKAKQAIRKLDYSVLVEGQIDLVLSHQAGVVNTVATSGTATTSLHLERLKHLSRRIIVGFDGDDSGRAAAEKLSLLGMSMGFEMKVADLPEGSDPAILVKENRELWKGVLRESLPAVEYFFNKIAEKEKDSRRLGKQIVEKILPMIKLIESAIEQSHFVSFIARKTGIKEEMLLDDLKRIKQTSLENYRTSASLSDSDLPAQAAKAASAGAPRTSLRLGLSRKEQLEERLREVEMWRKELPESAPEAESFKKEEAELTDNLAGIVLADKLQVLQKSLEEAERKKDQELIRSLTKEIQHIHSKIRALEEQKKLL